MKGGSILLRKPLTDEWETPQWLFDALNREFDFSLDPCSNGTNAKCKNFYTPKENGLLRDWSRDVAFMNPPYSQIGFWMRKAYVATQHGATVVCLVPARTDTVWWHSFAMKAEIRFIRGRLKFGNARYGAPFPSAIVVLRSPQFSLTSYPTPESQPTVDFWERHE